MKKSAPRKSSTPNKPLLSTIAEEVGSVAGTIVNTTRALAAGAASIVDTATKKAKKAKPQSRPKARRSVAKKKPSVAKKKGNKTTAKSIRGRKPIKSR